MEERLAPLTVDGVIIERALLMTLSSAGLEKEEKEKARKAKEKEKE